MASLTYEDEHHPGTAETYFSLMSREPDVQPWLITLSALQWKYSQKNQHVS